MKEQSSTRPGPTTGAQSIRRAVAILRAVANGGQRGSRLRDIAAACSLHTATTHRMLLALLEEGLLIHSADQKVYLLGPEILRLGARAQKQQVIAEQFTPTLTKIAQQTEDTVFLSIRSSLDAICLARFEGRFPIRTMTLEVGSVRPLGVGAGSLALCAFLPDAECETILRQNAGRYGAFGLDEAEIRKMVLRAKTLGYALNDGRILESVTGVGLPVTDVTGEIVVAISVAAISTRMTPSRAKDIAGMISSICAGDDLSPLTRQAASAR